MNTMVSTGGTPNLKNVGKLKGATEHRPGTYIYNDRMQVAAGVAGWDDCALNIYSTVVSRAGPDRGILDAGSKTLTSDTGGGLDGHGLILEHPEAKIARFAEEHGFLDLTRSNTRPNVGDVVRIVPNHVCVVVNMMDEVVMVRGDEISARCRSRRGGSCGRLLPSLRGAQRRTRSVSNGCAAKSGRYARFARLRSLAMTMSASHFNAPLPAAAPVANDACSR